MQHVGDVMLARSGPLAATCSSHGGNKGKEAIPYHSRGIDRL